MLFLIIITIPLGYCVKMAQPVQKVSFPIKLCWFLSLLLKESRRCWSIRPASPLAWCQRLVGGTLRDTPGRTLILRCLSNENNELLVKVEGCTAIFNINRTDPGWAELEKLPLKKDILNNSRQQREYKFWLHVATG